MLEACDACSASLPAMSLHEVLRISAKVHAGDPVLIVDMIPACTLTAGCNVRSLRALCCMGCGSSASARETRVLRAGDRGGCHALELSRSGEKRDNAGWRLLAPGYEAKYGHVQELSRSGQKREEVGKKLAAVGAALEKAFQGPQDVEGALVGSQVFIVQTRPQP